MGSVSIQHAKGHFSSLIKNVEQLRETVIICRHGQAVAQLTPVLHGKRLKVDSVLKKIKIKSNLTDPTTGEWENA